MTPAGFIQWTSATIAQSATITNATSLVSYSGSGSALILPSTPVMTDVGSPVSAAMLNGLIGGLDPLLQLLEQALEDQVFGQTLPMLGSELKSAFDNSIGALTAFKTLSRTSLPSWPALPHRRRR